MDNITHLRPVDIKPPEYKDPVNFLRNLADEIEKGQHGDVSTLAIALLTDGAETKYPLVTFGGGRNSDIHHVSSAFGAAQILLLRLIGGLAS